MIINLSNKYKIAGKTNIVAIKEAFAELNKEKRNIQSITVTELVKKAGITRGSFYTHYDNIYDVARDFQDEFLDVLFNDDFQITSLNNMEEYLNIIFQHLKTNDELYKMILSSDEPLIFMNRLSKMMNSHLNHFFESQDIKNLSLKVSFFVDGTISLFVKYFRNDIDTSLNDLYLFVIESFQKIIL